MCSATLIEVSAAPGRTSIQRLVPGEFLSGRPLWPNGSFARIALVATSMALLGGDHIDIVLRLGANAHVEIIEPTGMVAYDAAGAASSWNLDAALGPGAILVWRGAAFVAAAGSNVKRTTSLRLDRDARALIRESLVLGRSGETGIALSSSSRVVASGDELHVEQLVIETDSAANVGIVGTAKGIGTVSAFGYRPVDNGAIDPRRLDLAGDGAIWRTLEPSTHLIDGELDDRFRHWKSQLLTPEPPREPPT